VDTFAKLRRERKGVEWRRTEASKRVRRGTAKPRWGWSGVALLIGPQLSASDIDLPSLLPGRQSSDAQIVLSCVTSGQDIDGICFGTSLARRERNAWPRFGRFWSNSMF
jgi:hypothetical protein